MDKYLYNKVLLQLEQHQNERIVFWGASNFLKSFISNPDFKKYNIIGIIDINEDLHDTYIYGYKIFSPDKLKELKPVSIIITISNNYLYNYNNIKTVISKKYKYNDVKLLPNLVDAYYDNRVENIEVSNTNANFEFVIPTKDEITFFESLGSDYKKYSEMSDGERLFLTSLIQRNKPKKILELGVSKGGSSFLMLNAINTYGNAKLYSLDYNTEHFNIKGKLTGFLLDNFPHLKQNWSLYTGGLALNFLDKISSSTEESEKFDFCLIDTAHILPGEILDFLMVLPYMKQDSIIVFHDTNPHDLDWVALVCNLLMSSIHGHKMLPYPRPYPYPFNNISNIGALRLNETTFTSLYEIFNLLAIPWVYKPNYEEFHNLIEFFDKHYPKCYSDYFREVILFQERRLQKRN